MASIVSLGKNEILEDEFMQREAKLKNFLKYFISGPKTAEKYLHCHN